MQHLSHWKNALKHEFKIGITYHLGQSAKFGWDGPSQIVVGCSSSTKIILVRDWIRSKKQKHQTPPNQNYTILT
jgi:hypothetical protein